MEEEDVDGDNIIPNSIKCIIGKTYIFQVKVTAYNFFVCKQNFTVTRVFEIEGTEQLQETTKKTKNGNEVSKETICTEVKKRTFLKKSCCRELGHHGREWRLSCVMGGGRYVDLVGIVV
ncbi:hypothetical protein ACB094_08G171400 [Castanea mollissima]